MSEWINPLYSFVLKDLGKLGLDVTSDPIVYQ